jgi:hypothetical protein
LNVKNVGLSLTFDRTSFTKCQAKPDQKAPFEIHFYTAVDADCFMHCTLFGLLETTRQTGWKETGEKGLYLTEETRIIAMLGDGK